MIVLGRKGQILSTFTSVAKIKVLHKLEFAKNLIQIKGVLSQQYTFYSLFSLFLCYL